MITPVPELLEKKGRNEMGELLLKGVPSGKKYRISVNTINDDMSGILGYLECPEEVDGFYIVVDEYIEGYYFSADESPDEFGTIEEIQ